MKQLFTFLLLIVMIPWCQAQIITTVAGGGTTAPGDGGQAIEAKLQRPTGVAVDATGNLYICDRNANRVRKVTSDGMITTFAGTGVANYSGDGGPATAADIKGPYSVAIDNANNVYIGEQSGVVRKINTSGIISTYAGIATPGFSGDGGHANAAQLNGPSGIAIDAASNMYIADIDNNRIRKIDQFGIITTIAGTGATLYNGDNIPAMDANLYSPAGVSVDNFGNIYVAESRNHRIRKINPLGIIMTIAGSGTLGFSGDDGIANSANLNNPIGICVNNTGDVYFSDVLNMRIRKINSSGIISTVAGNGLSGSDGDGANPIFASISSPIGICLSNTGGMYIASTDRVRYIEGIVSVETINNYEQNSLIIYPNPNNGKFTIGCSSRLVELNDVIVTDMLGKVVYKAEGVKGQSIDINLKVPSGMYEVQLQGERNSMTQRIMVQH